MRCRTCDYRLWNLKSRQCPECFTPFVPSDYEFQPNSVEFCCPHCEQRYYGVGDKGHLVPSEFDCVQCGRHIDMDEMVLLPAEGLEEEETEPWRMPWLERSKRGFFRGLLSTIGGALVKPGRLIRSVPLGSSLPAAFWFAFLVHLVVVATGVGPWIVFPMLVGATTAPAGPTPFGAIGFGMGMVGVGMLAAGPISIVLWGGVTHGMLRLLASPAAGARRTYQAICYSGGANIITATPCLGTYVGSVWWVVSAVIMVKDGQRVSGGRAALAVLTLPILAFGAIVSFYLWLFVWLIPNMGAGPWGMQAETRHVLDAIVSYADDHRGHGPGHACELLVGGYLTADDFVLATSDTMVTDAQVGDITLGQFEDLAVDTRIAMAKQVADALPDDTVAHRLGDFVFTYHGVALADADPRLWVVICWPDPDVNTGNMSQNFVYVGMANGTTQSLPPGSFPASLAQQNSNRATAGLAPLPNPQTVKHGQPATAPRAEN